MRETLGLADRVRVPGTRDRPVLHLRPVPGPDPGRKLLLVLRLPVSPWNRRVLLMSKIERIGDPTRDKWLAFLGKALELGYISPAELERRAGIVLSATTTASAEKAYQDLPWIPWNDAWNAARGKGIYREAEIVPEGIITPDLPASLVAWTAGDTLILLGAAAFILGGWILFILAVSRVI
jgi:hypothetical protein